MKTKKCSKCGEIKPLDDFHKRKASPDGHVNQCKSCVSKIAHKKYLNNLNPEQLKKHKLKKKRKKLLKEGKSICSKCEKIKPINKFYKDKGKKSGLSTLCKKCIYKSNNKWRKNNQDKVNAYYKRKRAENPEPFRASEKKYRDTHKQKRYESCTKWRKNNPEKAKKIERRYRHKIRKTPKGKLNHRMAVSIRDALKENKNGRKWEDLVGYTVKDLKQHLEKQFTKEMSWEKFMNGEIHIDHIIPKSKFNYTKPEHIGFKRAWALENLQPLEAKENMRKHDKLIKDKQEHLMI